MNEIKDDPPPMPDHRHSLNSGNFDPLYTAKQYREGETEAFARGVAAGQAEIDRLTAELGMERVRLAACGVAALGYFNGCKDEYKSASLDDVLRLRAEADRLKAELGSLPEAQAEMLSTIKELRHINKNLVAAYEKEQEDNDVLRAKIKQMEEQEPVAISYTMEALVRGELTTEIKYHASFLKPVPTGTKLYTSPGARPPDGFVVSDTASEFRDCKVYPGITKKEVD